MAMQTDILAKNMTATGASGVGGTRIKGIYFVNGATAGSVSFKDGGVGGTERIKIDAPANTAGTGTTYLPLPGEGVLFRADPYVTITTVTSVTFFYG